MKEELKSHWKTWIFLLTLGTILIIIYKAIDSIAYLGGFVGNLISTLSPFLAGLLLSYLLYIPESKIEKIFKRARNRFCRKNARRLAILTTYIMAILILMIIINVILPVLIESINELIVNLQSYYSKVIDTYNNMPDDSIFKTEQVYNALKELQNLDLKQYLSIDRITGYVKSVVGVARGIFDVFVAIVVSVYILAERNEILKFFKTKTSEAIEKYFYKANNIFFKFISSQFIDAIIVGVLATIVMKILQIKYASLLGFTIGLFNMIPYFGAIIAVAFAAIITVITAGFSKAIIMLVIVIILQQVDANIINPKIIGDSLQISPLLVILAVTIGGAYFGVIGMFLGVPVAAVLKILVNAYIDNKLTM